MILGKVVMQLGHVRIHLNVFCFYLDMWRCLLFINISTHHCFLSFLITFNVSIYYFVFVYTSIKLTAGQTHISESIYWQSIIRPLQTGCLAQNCSLKQPCLVARV